MPLHLLPKKSWHVASTANVARVRRDEAAAQAIEEAEEQRMQSVDAERRLALLRGQAPPLADASIPTDEAPSTPIVGAEREKKRRKLAGEDDTDRDIRLASNLVPTGRTDDTAVRRAKSDAPLTDARGHIDLFPRRAVEKNAEVEAEKVRKKREYEDQYTMRFSNAAGFKEDVGGRPWYSGEAKTEGDEVVGKDVWGNEDPGRKEREKRRLQEREDPMVGVRRGVRELKRVEGERKKRDERREREMRELEREERRRRRRDRGRERVEEEGLEGFSLDGQTREKRHRRHGSREHDAERTRKRTHASSRDKEGARSRPGWEKGVGGRYSNQFMT